MAIIDTVLANLLSASVLCFALGALAVALRSDFALPEPVFTGISVYLMLSIGLRGGAEIAQGHAAAIIPPMLAALALSCATPLWCEPILRRLGRLAPVDAAAIAGHYGSVSALTFAAVTTMLDRQHVGFEAAAPAMLAMMEGPAVIVAIALARRGGAGSGASVMGEILSSKSVLLLAGGIVIGLIADTGSLAKVKPLFGDLFQGALCLFLLELGRLAASYAKDFRKVGPFLAGFAVVMPVLHAGLGIGLASLIGLSEGGAVVLGTLAASASYIAAPAAMRLALPEANPGYYLTCSVAITFPFNIIIGLPLYEAMARLLYHAG